MTNLYQMTVEIVSVSDGGEDDEVLGRYQFALFANSAEQAYLQAAKQWIDNWTFPGQAATGLMISVDREF